MSLPALQKFEQKIERQLRLLEAKKHIIERKIERQIRLFEQKRDGIGKKDRRADTAVRAEEGNSARRRSALHSLLDRTAAVDRRGDAVRKASRAHHGALCRSGQRWTGGRTGTGDGSGDRGAGRSRRRAFAPGARRVQSELLPNPALALSRRYAGAGRCLQPAPAAGDAAAAAGRRGRVRPAARHQADQRCACG